MVDPALVLDRLGIEAHRTGSGLKILCPWHEESDPSCSVRTGGRDGQIRLRCFACGNGGSVLDLISQVRGVDTAEALRIAGGWIGLTIDARAERREPPPVSTPRGERPGFTPGKQREALAPEDVAEFHDALVNDEALLEAVMSQRALTLPVIESARLGYDSRRKALVIPYFLDRQPRVLKFKLPKGNKPAYVRIPKGEVDFPYMIDFVPAADESVVVCEGELDCLVLRSLGVMNAVSVPNGSQSAGGHDAAKLAWLDHLERFKDIVICFDADEPGAKGAQQLVWRLGASRCRLVKLPPGVKRGDDDAKDPTDYVLAGAQQPLLDAIASARPIEHPLLDSVGSTPRDEAKRVMGFIVDPQGQSRPSNVPIGIYEFDRVMGGVRRAELTVIYGAPGAGKSVLANEILMRLLDRGERCAVVSLEMTRAQWLIRMSTRQTGCVPPALAALSSRRAITAEMFDAVADALERRGLFFMNAAGDTPIGAVLECLEFAVRRYDVQFAVVDHLQRLQPNDAKEDKDWAFNDKMTGQLESFAHRWGTGLIAPSHVTLDKRAGKNPKPAMADARGGPGAAQNAAAIIGLWRDDKRSADDGLSTSAVCALKLRDGIGVENVWTTISFDTRRLGFYQPVGADEDDNGAGGFAMFDAEPAPAPPPEDEPELVIGGDLDGIPEGF